MKYKKGDRVKVKKDLNTHTMLGVATRMIPYRGMVVTIKDVHAFSYNIEEDGGRSEWVESTFEPASPKDLLETGMVVRARSGAKYLYLNGVLMNENKMTSAGSLDRYTEGLFIKKGSSSRDILEIYCPQSRILDGFFYDHNLRLIWKRPEAKEMTLMEIERELGYSVKIIKGE